MDRHQFIQLMSERLKSVRNEYGFSQDRMASVLGISKKSLVETEKGRRKLSWPECAALASIFASSQILQKEFGGELSDMIQALAFAETHVQYPQTMGGKVWWDTLENHGGYRLQQNVISGHYRLLDPYDGRMMSSFEISEIKNRMKEFGIGEETGGGTDE